ncbi:hypothetical protein [Kribbella sp. NPDC051770]|uniref:hypothetical protein n=1 Tax=Kribbella sp. NPDC051770 TaxID=3155413 RepID=UPI0034185A55
MVAADSASWRSVVLDVARRADVENFDLTSGHARWGVYRWMMASPVEWGRLLGIVGFEPDAAIAGSVVLEMLERVPAAERKRWVDSISANGNHSLAVLRGDEIGILEGVTGELGVEFSVAPDQVLEWSDWLQRRASTESTSVGVLEQLSQAGRTKRVRGCAAERLRFLRRAEAASGDS